MAQQLFDAIKAGQLDEAVGLARQHPEWLATRDGSGATPILVAIYNRQPEIARALAEGAVIDFYEACALGKVDRIRQVLAESPSKASSYSNDGFSAVGLAAFFGRADAVRMLISAGADVNAAATNPFKVTALHAAVAGGNLDIVRAVLGAGADPNAPQQAGFRPIHEAGVNARRELAELLLAHGADPALTNDAGKSAVDMAREKGHTEFAQWLESAPRKHRSS